MLEELDAAEELDRLLGARERGWCGCGRVRGVGARWAMMATWDLGRGGCRCGCGGGTAGVGGQRSLFDPSTRSRGRRARSRGVGREGVAWCSRPRGGGRDDLFVGARGDAGPLTRGYVFAASGECGGEVVGPRLDPASDVPQPARRDGDLKLFPHRVTLRPSELPSEQTLRARVPSLEPENAFLTVGEPETNEIPTETR